MTSGIAKSVLLVAGICGLAASTTSAAITLVNGDFSLGIDGSGTTGAATPFGWTDTGAVAPGVGTDDDFGSGYTIVYLGNDRQISQTVGHTIADGEQYVVSFRQKDNFNGGDLAVELFYNDGVDDFTLETFTTTPVGSVTSAELTSAIITAGNGAIGNTLGIRLGTDDGWLHITDVNITAIPEPSSFALLGLAGLTLIVRRRR